MLSLFNPSAAQAATYYQKDSYYTQESGQWWGRGAQELGLSGEVSHEDFSNLILGNAPDGSELVPLKGGKDHRAGLDMTLSAPKSVSILALLDPQVQQAHESAVNEALTHTQETFAQTRQTMKGHTEPVDTKNLVVAKFEHWTSRELDPQLHTHCFVMNATQRADGKWRALHNDQIYQNKMMLGVFYRNELASQLNDLGYQIQSDAKGLFEVQGVPQELIETFSTRSSQIDHLMTSLREKYPHLDESKLREYATLDSRKSKKDVDLPEIRQSWMKSISESNLSQNNLPKSAEIERRPQEVVHAELKRSVMQSALGLSEKESVFSRSDLMKVSLIDSLGSAPSKDLSQAIYAVLKEGFLQPFSKGLTTQDIKEKEAWVLGYAKSSQGVFPSQNSSVDVPSQAPHLTQSQQLAAKRILTSKDGVTLIQGDAGVGKTTLIKTVLQSVSSPTLGLAFTGKAAKELEQSTGMKSQTLHQFLSSGEGVKKGGMWFVDEASMVGSHQMYDVLQNARQSGSQVVLLGDTKQFQSIQAGGLFKELQKEIPTVHMNEILRQKESWYQEAVRSFSQGDIEKTFAKLHEQKKIYEISSSTQLRQKLVTDYLKKNDPKQTLIVTPSNAEKKLLNHLIRDGLKETNHLQKEVTISVKESVSMDPLKRRFLESFRSVDWIKTADSKMFKVEGVDEKKQALILQKEGGFKQKKELHHIPEGSQFFKEKEIQIAKGEQLVFNQNDKKLGVQNGTTGVVDEIQKNGKLSIKLDDQRQIKVDPKRYPFIDYGYALTDYKSQGQTSKEVLIHAPLSGAGSPTFNRLYVGLTRGQMDAQIYTQNRTELQKSVQQIETKTTTLTPGIKESVENKILQKQRGDFQVRMTLMQALRKQTNQIISEIKNPPKDNNKEMEMGL